MALIRYIPNKFAGIKYDYEAKPEKLAEALYKFTLHYPDLSKPFMNKKTNIYINGRVITPEECSKYVLRETDIVEVTHTLGEPTTIIISVIVAVVVGALMYYAMTQWMDFSMDDEELSGNQTYDWDGPKTNINPESPVPIVYGEHLVGGQLINFNIWSSGNENYLDILLALSEGEIAGVVDEDQTGLVSSVPTTLEAATTQTPYIKIDEQFASAYEDSYWAGRVGTISQTSIQGFRELKTVEEYSHPVPAERDSPGGQWTVTHTTGTDVDGFTVNLSTPSLYAIFDSGNISKVTIKYRIRYRVNDPQGSWVYSPTVAGGGVDDPASWHKIIDATRSEVKASQTIRPGARNTYDIQVQRYEPASTTISKKRQIENKLNTETITEIISEDLSYPYTTILALRVKATDQISGQLPNIQTLIRGIKVRVPDIQYGGGNVPFEDVYWTGSAWKKLSNDDTCTWDGVSYVTQYTSNPAYILRDIMLNERYGMGEVVYSADIDEDSINTAAKKCWQKVGTTHKSELHVVVDQPTEPEDLLAQLGQVSRIKIFWAGGYIKFKYEEDEDPVQVFSMGNIKRDSFKVDYTDYTKIPNRIEVTYANKDNDWKKDIIEVVDETEWALGKPKRTKSISLIGVTDPDQALREARYFLNKGRYVRKGIEFVTTIAACHSEPGDVIAFQHDVPQWGWGGRVLEGTSNTCTIDQDIPAAVVAAPTDYDLKIIHIDDTIETKDIVSVDGKTITISGTFTTTPSEDEPYILGKEGSTIAEYRIQNVSLTKEEEVQIQATEHNVNIYADTGLYISIGESTELPNPAAFAPQVSGLTVYEIFNKAGLAIAFRQPDDGVVGSEITLTDVTNGVCTTSDTQALRKGDFIKFSSGDFNGRTYKVTALTVDTSFTLSDTTLTDSGSPGTCYEYDNSLPLTWDHADIYISTDNVKFTKIGEGYGDDAVEYYDVFPGLTYYIKVYSINKSGIKNTDPATANIEIKGVGIGRPSAPTGIEIFNAGNSTEFAGRDCKIAWRLNAPFGGSGSLKPELPANISIDIAYAFVKDFVVQVWSATQNAYSEWVVSSLLREEITRDKWYVYTYEKNFEDNSGSTEGNLIFRVYQRNYFGALSEQYARQVALSDTPSTPTGLTATAEEDGVSFVWDEVTDSDFSYYEYRTKVDSGSWSSWLPSYDNKATRWLTGAELAAQGQEQSTVYIEVRSVDIFGATSSSSSTNTSCSNFKGYFTVSPIPGKGHFTTIASAVEALYDTGGTIVLKEGTHQSPTLPITFPDKDITIVGDGSSVTKVVLNTTTQNAFYIPSRSSVYNFRDFTASWVSLITPSYLIYCSASSGAAYNTSNAKVICDNLKLDQMNARDSNQNYGFLIYGANNRCHMTNCQINNGARGLWARGNDINIEGNTFNGQVIWSVYGQCSAASDIGFKIHGNLFKNFRRIGIYTYNTTTNPARGVSIKNNHFVLNTATGNASSMYGPDTLLGIYCGHADYGEISNNTFIFKNASVVPTGELCPLQPIAIGNITNFIITNNSFLASMNSPQSAKFISINDYSYDCTILGNAGVLLNATSNGNYYGVYLAGNTERCIVSNNHLSFNNRVADTGIYTALIPSGALRHYGTGNLIYQAGTPLNVNASCEITATIVP